MRVGLSTTAIFGDLVVLLRKPASNIIRRYATPRRPVIDCKMNELE